MLSCGRSPAVTEGDEQRLCMVLAEFVQAHCVLAHHAE